MFEALLLFAAAVLLTAWTIDPHTLLIAVGLLVLTLPGIVVMRGAAPFVPTPQRIWKTMMEFADIKPGDSVYDLGCGDGRLVLEAARRGGIAIGYELSLPTFLVAKVRSLLQRNASVSYRNFWSQNYRDADVIFCFLLQGTIQRFGKEIWPTLKPGCRVVSHAFFIEGMKPEKHENSVYLYIKR